MESNTAGSATGCGPAYRKAHWGYRGYQPPYAGSRKAPVSIYKTENSYELMVFAPGRQKENFSIQLKGDELVISYKPTIDTSGLNWVRREYSRGGFERSFITESTMDTDNISASYENGVLTISLPLKQGIDTDRKEVKIN